MSQIRMHSHRGDERLLRACRIVDHLCADRRSARTRLELELGGATARTLVLCLAGCDTSARFRRSALRPQPAETAAVAAPA
jgi:hypothetical protein